jgi:hypothetical protein
MTLSAAPGSNERAMRVGSVAAAGSRSAVGPVATPVPPVAGSRDAGGAGLLLIVGLLLGLILISAGCGPPS